MATWEMAVEIDRLKAENEELRARVGVEPVTDLTGDEISRLKEELQDARVACDVLRLDVDVLEEDRAELRAQLEDYNGADTRDGLGTKSMYAQLVQGWSNEHIIDHIMFWRDKSTRGIYADWGIARRDRVCTHHRIMAKNARSKLGRVKSAAKEWMVGQNFEAVVKLAAIKSAAKNLDGECFLSRVLLDAIKDACK